LKGKGAEEYLAEKTIDYFEGIVRGHRKERLSMEETESRSNQQKKKGAVENEAVIIDEKKKGSGAP